MLLETLVFTLLPSGIAAKAQNCATVGLRLGPVHCGTAMRFTSIHTESSGWLRCHSAQRPWTSGQPVAAGLNHDFPGNGSGRCTRTGKGPDVLPRSTDLLDGLLHIMMRGNTG